MTGDYIPRTDSDFQTWSKAFVSNISWATGMGITPADSTAITTAVSAYSDSLDAVVMNQRGTAMALATKDTARKSAEALIRTAVRRIQASAGVTDNVREALGITIPDATPTAAAMPAGAPMLKVDTSERLKHTIAFFQTTPDGKGSRGKPAGAKGCAIYSKIGTPGGGPTLVQGAPTDMEFLALDTASPYVVDYGTAEGGKTVYYMAQWMGGPHGDEPGPWSETVEATVVG